MNSVQIHRNAKNIASTESQGHTTKNNTNTKSTDAMVKNLLGKINSSTPSEMGNRVNNRNSGGNPIENGTKLFKTPTPVLSICKDRL